MGRKEDAIIDYSKAIQINPRCAIYNDLGIKEDALIDHSRAIEIYPNYANAHDNKGRFYSEY